MLFQKWGGYNCKAISTYSLGILVHFFLRPVSSGWWFTTSYIILILICPVINAFINRLTKKGFLLFLFVIWAFYYSIGFVIEDTYISLIRAIFFYVLGSFIKLHCTPKIEKSAFMLNVLVCIFLWFLMAFCFYNYYYIQVLPFANEEKSFIKKILGLAYRVMNNCIALPLFAFCFFRIFQNLNLGFRNVINRISSLTFGIYLIHDSSFLRILIWQDIFLISDVQFKSKFFPLIAVFDIIVIFSVCAAIDFLRQKYIEKKYLLLYEKISEKLKSFCIRC